MNHLRYVMYKITCFIVMICLAGVCKSQADTCFTIDYFNNLKKHVSHLIEYSETTTMELRLTKQLLKEKQVELGIRQSMFDNEKRLRLQAQQNMINLNRTVKRLDKKLSDAKRKRWKFFAAGVGVSLAGILIIAL